jgi:hypothetical protein
VTQSGYLRSSVRTAPNEILERFIQPMAALQPPYWRAICLSVNRVRIKYDPAESLRNRIDSSRTKRRTFSPCLHDAQLGSMFCCLYVKQILPKFIFIHQCTLYAFVYRRRH